jgi:hypothetical protein
MYVFTRKVCRVMDLINGRTKKVVELCSDDEEITAASKFTNCFIIGTSKGDIICFSL